MAWPKYNLTTALLVLTVGAFGLGAFFGNISSVIPFWIGCFGAILIWTCMCDRQEHWLFGTIIGILYLLIAAALFVSLGSDETQPENIRQALFSKPEDTTPVPIRPWSK